MPATLPNPAPATERRSLAGVSGKPIKADLRPQVPATRLREIAAETVRRVSSQKAAALDIGVHEARLSHKLQDGSLTLAQLETLGPAFAAALGTELVEQFASLATPKARAQHTLRTIRGLLDELAQAVELIA